MISTETAASFAMSTAVPADAMDDRIRLARRRRLETEVTLRDPEGFGSVAFPCRDISVTGVFVYSTACVQTGSEFICEVAMEDGEVVEVVGHVSRVVLDAEMPERSGMGIEFTKLAREARERLVAFTARSLAPAALA